MYSANVFSQYLTVLQGNPVYRAYENTCCYCLDQSFAEAVKLYYWPYFVAGNFDSWKDILTCQISSKNKTSNIWIFLDIRH